MRALLTSLLGALVRLFFRRVEVTGRAQVPSTGPAVFVGNHPNALMDPVMLLVHAGRPVSFMAKEPLFRMPVIGILVRALDSIPVYRKMDQAETARNVATFRAARDLLARGGSIAIFPEGTSHSDPAMKPFRTGAARIALSAAGADGLAIVPVGLFYTAKTRFRSSALLCFGAPIGIDPVPVEADGEPAASAVRRLTAQLESALAGLTLQADRHESLRLAEAAERIISSAEGGGQDLAGRLQRRQRLVAGSTRLRAADPARLAQITSRIARYTAALSDADLTPELLPVHGYRARTVIRIAIRALLVLAGLLPLAIVGALVHLPGWLIIDAAARYHERTNPDVVATVKVLGGLLFYPLTWLGLAWWTWSRFGWPAGLLAVAAGPVTGWAALRFIEGFDRLAGGARGLVLALTGRRRFLRLVAEREAIRSEVTALGHQYNV